MSKKSIQNTKRIKYKKQGGKCFYCGKQLFLKNIKKSREVTLDHLIPRSMGGTTKRDNLVVACNNCNQWKGDTSFWFVVLAYLKEKE
jgi:5-methylcytosine-specific restriction endonuclease McrA